MSDNKPHFTMQNLTRYMRVRHALGCYAADTTRDFDDLIQDLTTWVSQASLQHACDQRDRFEALHSEALERLREVNAEANELRQIRDSLSGAVDRLDKAYDTMRRDRDNVMHALGTAIVELDNAKRDLAAANEANSALAEDYERVGEQLKAEQSKPDLSRALSNKEIELASARKARNAAENNTLALRAALRVATTDIERLRGLVETARKQRDELFERFETANMYARNAVRLTSIDCIPDDEAIVPTITIKGV